MDEHSDLIELENEMNAAIKRRGRGRRAAFILSRFAQLPMLNQLLDTESEATIKEMERAVEDSEKEWSGYDRFILS